jgi:hypothetical protein
MCKKNLTHYALLLFLGLFALQLSSRPSRREIVTAYMKLKQIAETNKGITSARTAVINYHRLVHDKNLEKTLNGELAKQVFHSNNKSIIKRHRNLIHREQIKLGKQREIFYKLLEKANDNEYKPLDILYSDIEFDESWLQKINDILGRKLHLLGQTNLKISPDYRHQPLKMPSPQKTPPTRKAVNLGIQTTVDAAITAEHQEAVTSQAKDFIHKYDHNFFIEYFADYNKEIGADGYPIGSRIKYTSKTATSDSNDIVPLKAIIGSTSEVDKGGALSFDQAEKIHCWIQWAFPSPYQSAYNSKAPISNEVIKAKFNEEKPLRDVLKRCLKLYLNFIGLSMSDRFEPFFYRMSDDATHKVRMRNFLTNTHNFARVTRILTSLKYHGLSDHARKLAAYLIGEKDYFKSTFSLEIPSETEKIWRDAIRQSF